MCNHQKAARHGHHWKCNIRSKIQLCQSMRIYSRTFLLNFIPIRFEETEPQAFMKTDSPTRRTTGWVAIWDQFMIQKIPHLKFKYNHCTYRKSINTSFHLNLTGQCFQNDSKLGQTCRNSVPEIFVVGFFYRPFSHPITHPTVFKHWMAEINDHLEYITITVYTARLCYHNALLITDCTVMKIRTSHIERCFRKM